MAYSSSTSMRTASMRSTRQHDAACLSASTGTKGSMQQTARTATAHDTDSHSTPVERIDISQAKALALSRPVIHHASLAGRLSPREQPRVAHSRTFPRRTASSQALRWRRVARANTDGVLPVAGAFAAGEGKDTSPAFAVDFSTRAVRSRGTAGGENLESGGEARAVARPGDKKAGAGKDAANPAVANEGESSSRAKKAVLKLPWLRHDTGESMAQLEQSGFFERTVLPPKKYTRLPVLQRTASLAGEAQIAAAAADRSSIVLTPTGFYHEKGRGLRFSWSVIDPAGGDRASRALWIPASKFSWARGEAAGVLEACIEADGGVADVTGDLSVEEASDPRTVLSGQTTLVERRKRAAPSPSTIAEKDDVDSDLNTVPDQRCIDEKEKGPKGDDEKNDREKDMLPQPLDISIRPGKATLLESPEVTAGKTDSAEFPRFSLASSASLPFELGLKLDQFDSRPSSISVLVATPSTEPIRDQWGPLPLGIFGPSDVPDEAQVVALIAEDISPEGSGLEPPLREDDQTGWPTISSPGLPPLRMIGTAVIDDEDEDSGDEHTMPDTPMQKIEMPIAGPDETGKELYAEIIKEARWTEGGKQPTPAGQAPYYQGPIRLHQPEDLFEQGTIMGLGIWSDVSSAEVWEGSEKAIIDGILDYFSAMLDAPDATCGAEGSPLTEEAWRRCPVMDAELIRANADIDKTEMPSRLSIRPPPIPDLPVVPPPLPRAPMQTEPLRVKRAKTRSKPIYSPGIGSILLRRKLF